MIVVSDTSPVLSLALVGQLDLLKRLYGSIVIPRAVHDELVVGGAAYDDGDDIVRQPWISVGAATNSIVIALLLRELDRGEAEAIALAVELKASLLLIDEFKGRRLAEYLGLPHAGVVDLLGEAKRHRYLPAIKPTLDALIERANFRVSAKLYQRTLEIAGEWTNANAA